MILEFTTDEEATGEQKAFAKSAEYLIAPEGSLTKFRWEVRKHPEQDLWAVVVSEGAEELSLEDTALLKDEWVVANEP